MTTWAGLIVFEIRNGVTQIQINCICKILGEILIIRCLNIIEYGMFSTASLYYSINNEYDIMQGRIQEDAPSVPPLPPTEERNTQ